MKRLGMCVVILVGIFALGGCYPGITRLGDVTLKDGSTVEYVQGKTKGHSGPDLTFAEGWRYADGKSTKVSEYRGAAAGLVESMLSGIGSAALLGGAAYGAAKVLRPDVTKVTQNQEGFGVGLGEGGGGGFALGGTGYGGNGYGFGGNASSNPISIGGGATAISNPFTYSSSYSSATSSPFQFQSQYNLP